MRDGLMAIAYDVIYSISFTRTGAPPVCGADGCAPQYHSRLSEEGDIGTLSNTFSSFRFNEAPNLVEAPRLAARQRTAIDASLRWYIAISYILMTYDAMTRRDWAQCPSPQLRAMRDDFSIKQAPVELYFTPPCCRIDDHWRV